MRLSEVVLDHSVLVVRARSDVTEATASGPAHSSLHTDADFSPGVVQTVLSSLGLWQIADRLRQRGNISRGCIECDTVES
jgi:hypothetical protein